MEKSSAQEEWKCLWFDILHQAAAGAGRSQLGDERNIKRTSLGLYEVGVVCHFLLSPTHRYSVSQEDIFIIIISAKSSSCLVSKSQ